MDHDELGPSWATDTQFKIMLDHLHEYRLQPEALQYQTVIQWRLAVPERTTFNASRTDWGSNCDVLCLSFSFFFPSFFFRY